MPSQVGAFTPDDRGWPDLRWSFTDHGRGEGPGSASAACTPGSREIVLLGRDVAGPAYSAMLDLARRHSLAFSLVWRDDTPYGPRARSLLRDLGPHLCYEHHAREWRGTTLLQAKAWVRWFRPTAEALALIARPDALFAWRGPELPEDMAFYTRDGRGWLGSTAHEGLAWVDMTAIGRDASSAFLAELRPER